jgi:hypothetical protein
VPLVVGESGFVSGDFHRLKSATANESRKKSQSNQGFYAFFFFQTGSKKAIVLALLCILSASFDFSCVFQLWLKSNRLRMSPLIRRAQRVVKTHRDVADEETAGAGVDI